MRKTIFILFALVLFSCSKPIRFELQDPGITGIDFTNRIVETDSLNAANYEYIYNGAGVGIADLNNDGLPDIILVGNQVQPRVYLNLGNFKFKDISANFPGLDNGQWYSGVAIGDVNADGWQDVYLTSTGKVPPSRRKNKLWINNGCKKGQDPTFTEMAEQYGVADTSESVSAAFFDYDRDGDLDLYVLNNTLNQRMNTSYRAKVNDGTASNNDQLYRNNGDGTFTKVTIPAGITNEGFGLGIAMGDVNKDGYPDIYISNDFNSNDLLYINQGDGTFKNEIRKYISYQSKSSMGDDMADVNNDGNPDMFTLDMMPEDYTRRKQTNNGFSYIYYLYDAKYNYEHQYVRNMLHVHNGFMNGEMLPYSEEGQMAGIFQTGWSWSPLFADFNNDGNKDLIISHGYPRDLTDKDWTKYKATVSGVLVKERDVINMAPESKIPNMAYENEGNLKFVNKSKEWLPQIPAFSYGAAFVDLDNDGDLDYVVNNINDKAFILRNYTVERSKGDANYIRINLKGKPKNTMAIGAKVEIWSNGTYQFTEHFLTRGYASSIDPVVHFGLGKNKLIDSVRITWPASGYITVVKNVKANQRIDIDENNSTPPYANMFYAAPSTLLFSQNEGAIDYVHEQDDFVDFFLNQRIIPHKFSQIGPAMAKGDIDGDGREDLVIGATNKLPTMVYLRKGNGFQKTEIEGLTNKKGFTEADLAVVDIDKDGHNDIVAVAGGYENSSERDYTHYLYQNRNGSFVRVPLPVPGFPASVVRPCDFNHDGYVDLFIGARVKKGVFPRAERSWLIVNEKGVLHADSTTSFDLGMVTDAVWTDYDHDGWEDLLVVREYDSPILLKNMNGKKLVPQSIPSLDSHHGIWYSIAAGDFNKDGYDDYILGNLGENNRFTVSEKYPLQLYAVDLDLDGNLDPIISGYWKDSKGVMREYPVNYLDELNSQSNFFVKKFKTYKQFSFATMQDILEKNLMKRMELKLYANTAASYILWNDKGKFRWEKLPQAVQVSPVTRMVVKDFNGDGYPDVLLGGNDYSYDVSTGYYDAMKGIVLLNKGKDAGKDGGSSFKVLTPAESGILLQGMLQSLLCFDGDTTLIVAGMNRARAVTFKLNPKPHIAK